MTYRAIFLSAVGMPGALTVAGMMGMTQPSLPRLMKKGFKELHAMGILLGKACNFKERYQVRQEG